MRRDYMSLHGFPIKTTPFLDDTNGLFYNNYIAAGPNTPESLIRTLYRKDNANNAITTDNIISLANLAGFKTYWLSNQGGMGVSDNVASRIGHQANYFYFFKKLAYDSKGTKNTMDDELIPYFEKSLSDETNKAKLIVIHIMGSHFTFCDRLRVVPKPYFLNQKMSCYLDTIKSTDSFIKSIVSLLKDKNETYSLIYFSDHGLAHVGNGDDLSLLHRSNYKQDYEIPLVKLSSDDTTRTYIKEKKSAFNFLNGYVEWLGISERNLVNKHFFEDISDDPVVVFDWNKLVNFDTLQDDPAKQP